MKKIHGMKALLCAAMVGALLLEAVGGTEVESWTLAKPRVWSRARNAISLTTRADGVFEVRHDGDQDWSMMGFPVLDVKPGDVFRIVSETESIGRSRPISTSVILQDAKGGVMAWTWGASSFAPGSPDDHRFMVPPGGAKIQARIVGSGCAAAAVKSVTLTRVGNAFSMAAQAEDQVLESDTVRVTLRGSDGSLVVEDRRSGRVWAPADGMRGKFVVLKPKEPAPAGHARISLLDAEHLRRFDVDVALEQKTGEVVVSVSGEGELKQTIDYPAPFASRAGDRLIVPLNEGVGYPVEEEHQGLHRLISYGGHGICMSFFGVQEDATGAGWMAIIETPDDAAMMPVRSGADKLWTAGPSWNGQKKRFGYTRRVRYAFFGKGGYVAMCKRYRRHAKEIGKFKSFAEKVKERPNVDRLLGAPNIWCWDRDKLSVVSNLVAAGIDRFLWSAGGSPAEVKAMAAMPNVLVGRYDIYQDIYHPDQLKKLGRKSGCNTEAWPRDVIWNSADSNDWRHAWGVKAKDGTWTYCAMMCDTVAPSYERRNVKKELAVKPYNTRFIDTTVAAPWQECWNPAHPMTRSDSRHWKMELLRILGDEFKLVVGSETGHDASVPFCDYYEGMLSLGPYRVPDSGRNIPQIWTNVPPRVAKYQLGEQYRLPLWELVYHECVCAHWYWGDYNNKLPSLWWKRDLFNVLYGTMGMYIFNKRQWAEDRDRFVRSYRITSPVARATGYSEMLDHQVLSPDRAVQRTRFADGTVVTVNFGDAPFKLPDGSALPARSHRVARVATEGGL